MVARSPQVAVTLNAPRDTGVRVDRKPSEALGVFGWVNMKRAQLLGLGPAGARQRAQSAIHAYVGMNGAGKTLCMVLDVAQDLDGRPYHCEEEDHLHNDPQYDDRGEFTGFGEAAQHDGFVRVLSTVRLLDDATGELHSRYERFSDWRQLDGLEHAVLVLDEITGVAHSRDGGSMPHDIMNRLMQMRKGDVRVLWSAPAWMRADKLVREVTQAVTIAVGSSPARGGGGLWRQNRFFRFRTFSMEDFDEWTSGRAEKLTPLVSDYVWGPSSRGFRLYNTKQKVTRIGHSNDSGICVECGGTRRRQECSCHDYTARKADRRRELKAV